MMNVIKQLLIVLLLMHSVTVWAKEGQYLLTEKTYKILTAAQELMTAEKYTQAEKQLLTLLEQSKTGSYDKAVVQQTLGYVYSATERYGKASKQFQQALSSDALPEQVSHTLRYNLAQLLIADQRFKEGISLLQQWIEADASPSSSAYVLLATAYYYVENFKQAVHYLTTAIELDSSPQEAWYQVLLSAHIELKQNRSAIKVLEILISDFPYQQNYWQQLTALYLQDNQQFSALAAQSLAQRIELTDKRVLISLADMYRYLHIPYKAALLLTKGIDDGVIEPDLANLSRLADSWIVARELDKAASVLKQAARMDSSGEADLKYGRVLFDLEDWQQSVQVLSQSLKELKDKRLGTAALWSGMAQYHLGNFDKANTLLNKAARYKRERTQARYWLDYIEQQNPSETVEQS